jgi:hypothetical protein
MPTTTTSVPAPPAAGDWRPGELVSELVSELSITAAAIGIDDADLAAALSEGKTVADVARAHGVSVRRVIVALVSDAVQEVAADVRSGELSPGHVRWLVALATQRAQDQVTTRFPEVGFRRHAALPGACS